MENLSYSVDPNNSLNKNESESRIGESSNRPVVKISRTERNRNEKYRYLRTLATSTRVTNAVHLFAVSFTVLILYLALSGELSFFTWHPIFMAVGWILFMTEAILTLNKDNSFLQNLVQSNRVFFHWILQTVAVTAITLGFIVAFKNKNDKNKAHFKSWHALFGLLGVILAIPSGLNGVITLYSKELKNFYSPKLNKFIHILTGTLTYLFGGISAVLSIYTKWFERKTNSNYVTFGLALLLVTCVVLWTLIEPVKNVSRRFKNLISM